MFTSLQLIDFRNYINETLTFSPEVNIITGSNGHGKTNLLEALQIMSCTKSGRAQSDRELIRFGCDRAFLIGDGREIVFGDSRRLLKADGVTVPPREWIGKNPSVYFGPEDLMVIKSDSSRRRKFLDQAICQISYRYISALGLYRKNLAQKRSILKTREFSELLPDYNKKLAECSDIVTDMRGEYFSSLKDIAEREYALISGGAETLNLEFKPNRYADADFDREWAAGTPLYGCHRDDFMSFTDGRELKKFGSQGQTRTAAVALTIAAREIFNRRLGSSVLLLDDVLSELDADRAARLSDIGGGQVFITDCRPDRLNLAKNGQNIHIVDGKAV